MAKIDRAGWYRGEILESHVGLSSGSFPQAVLKLSAEEKFVDNQVEKEHFKLETDGWVDWSSFEETIIGYLILFKDTDNFSPETQLFHYDQLKIAAGWSGLDFDELENLAGKKILFRVDEEEYKGKPKLKVNWIDHIDAEPSQQLKSLDSDAIKVLNGKLRFAKTTKAVSAKTNPTPAAPTTSTPVAITKKPFAGKSGAQEKIAKVQAEMAAKRKVIADKDTDGYTKDDAWNDIQEKKGETDDSEINDAWIAACNEISGDGNKPEEEYTPTEWAKIRDVVIRDLVL